MMWKKCWIIGVVLAIALYTGLAVADGRPNVKRPEPPLRELLVHAGRIVVQSGDAEAIQLLKKARRLVGELRLAAQAGDRARVRRIEGRVRELVHRAIRIAGASEHAPRALGGLRELLKRADGIVVDSGKPGAERALSRVHALEQRASEMVEEKPLLALRWIREAAGLAEGALLTVDGPGEIRRIAEKLDGLLTEADVSVSGSGNGKAIELLEKAQELKDAGSKAAENERYHLAFRTMRRAVHFVSQAIRMVEERGEGESEGAAKPVADVTPKTLSLSQNFPNPFNAETTITYALPNPGEVTLTVYNTLGQRIRTLIHETQEAGSHTTSWDSRDDEGRVTAGGVYIYRVEMGDQGITKQMILLK